MRKLKRISLTIILICLQKAGDNINRAIIKKHLKFFKKAGILRIKNAIYNPKAYLHLEAVKKAVAGPKNN